MTIGQTIRALRKKRNLTQAQLGELCGMTGGAISSYENGGTVPKRKVLEKIAQALDVPVDRLTMDAAPALASGRREDASDALLYDGVLTALKELYGIVEGRVIVGENGVSRRYYIVKQISGDFVLYDDDIAALVRSAKASLPPLAAYMRQARGQAAG